MPGCYFVGDVNPLFFAHARRHFFARRGPVCLFCLLKFKGNGCTWNICNHFAKGDNFYTHEIDTTGRKVFLSENRYYWKIILPFRIDPCSAGDKYNSNRAAYLESVSYSLKLYLGKSLLHVRLKYLEYFQTTAICSLHDYQNQREKFFPLRVWKISNKCQVFNFSKVISLSQNRGNAVIGFNSNFTYSKLNLNLSIFFLLHVFRKCYKYVFFLHTDPNKKCNTSELQRKIR